MAKKFVFGQWAFLIGVILAVIIALLGTLDATWLTILFAVGLIVGLLNVAAKEATPFLFASIALLLASSFGKEVLAGITVIDVTNILNAILALVVPALIIVALREVFTIVRK
jgi:hypothetical protein